MRRANAVFSAVQNQCAKQFCKRFYNFKFESAQRARHDHKIGGVVDVLEIENDNTKDYRIESRGNASTRNSRPEAKTTGIILWENALQ